MGGSSSKIEQDKALQLCRERRRFVKQALDGRCSLAAAHVAYIHSLKNTGTVLTNFLQHSTTATETSTGVQLALTESKSHSHFSFSSHSPPSSIPSTRYHSNHMKFTSSTPSVSVVRKPSHENSSSHFLPPPPPDGAPPWDYFSLFPPGPVDDSNISHFDQEQHHGHIDNRHSFSSTDQETHNSDDEFDEPSTDTLVRSFKNLTTDPHQALDNSPHMPSARSLPTEPEIFNSNKSNSPNLSPLKPTSSAVPTDFDRETSEAASTGNKADDVKDFFSSIKEIEHLFIKASDSGKEVPRMLEANKLHFRPFLPGRQAGESLTSTLFNACFSCGEDLTRVPEEPAQAQAGVSYLTWHRTASSRSSSSRNPLTTDSREDDTKGFITNNCMISGSHASTLDRLYAWERKLYDEIKASEIIRREYDVQCKILRQHESKGEDPHKADKFRAVVKDLHSRIRVAIHRIATISTRIEELRDRELQPQLEELIEGLSRMWEVMLECHKLQFEIISKAYRNNKTEISFSESHRQHTVQLENEVRFLSSNFSRWIGAQRSYVQALDGWLSKCVSLPKKTSRRRRRDEGSSWRKFGPPIYVACGEWLQMLDNMPAKDVVDSMKGLASETSRFLPSQEKNQRKSVNISRDEGPEVWIAGADRFQSSLADFIGQLNKFAVCSVELYKKLEEDIKDSKNKYESMKNRT